MIRVDMHFHSTCSDGSDSPEALARLARKRGCAMVSLTGHDTMEGVPAVLTMCRRLGLRAVSGVEISAEYSGTLHILGYNYDIDHADFQRALKTIQRHRDERNVKILARLSELGIPLTMEDVQREAGVGVIGRPHCAFALIRRGIVHDMMSAFSR